MFCCQSYLQNVGWLSCVYQYLAPSNDASTLLINPCWYRDWTSSGVRITARLNSTVRSGADPSPFPQLLRERWASINLPVSQSWCSPCRLGLSAASNFSLRRFHSGRCNKVRIVSAIALTENTYSGFGIVPIGTFPFRVQIYLLITLILHPKNRRCDRSVWWQNEIAVRSLWDQISKKCLICVAILCPFCVPFVPI